jgi:hypothetical protein
MPIDAKHASCPKDIPSLCTKKVLCMEAIQGVPIKSKMNRVMKDLADQQGKTVAELTAEFEEQYKDPVKMKEWLNAPPPSEFLTSAGIYYLHSRDYVRNSMAFLYNWTVGIGGIIGAPINYKWSAMPVNGP